MDDLTRKSLRCRLMFKSGDLARDAAICLLKHNVPLKKYEANRIAELLKPKGRPKGQLKMNHFCWYMTYLEALEEGASKKQAVDAILDQFHLSDERTVRKALKHWGAISRDNAPSK